MIQPDIEATTATAKKAVVYLRVSTRDQATRGGEAEGFSIPAQRDACVKKAADLGAYAIAEFVDAGESARSANRPELQRMLRFVKETRVDYVIVHKVDRLARNRVDDVEINVALTAAGAQLVSCTENIDETPSGMLVHGIMSTIAEFYSRNLATESKKGMLQKARNGGTNSRAPFGYLNIRRRDQEGRDIKTVELDPDRSTWVPWIFEKYSTGEWTTSMIADELQRHAVETVPTPNRPRAPLATSHVAQILKNRYYLGYVRFDGVEYPGNHARLVSEPLFDTCQQVRAARHQSGQKPRVHAHYLKGSIFCGECGEPLTFELTRNRHGQYYEYFYCLGRQRMKNGCSFRAVQTHVVEDLVAQRWHKVERSDIEVREIRRLVQEHIERVLPEQIHDREQAQTRLAAIQRKADKVMQAHYADAISLDQLKLEQSRLSVERASTEQLLKQTTMTEELLDARLDACCTVLANAGRLYEQSSKRERQQFNQAVFSAIYIDDDDLVGADFTPAFRGLVGDDLALRLRREEAKDRIGDVRTMDLSIHQASDPEAIEVVPVPRVDLPGHAWRVASRAQFADLLPQERPLGRLRWETTNPGPLQVRGSNDTILVAGAGFEPATSGL